VIRARDKRLVDVDRLIELFADAAEGVFVHLTRDTYRVYVTTIEGRVEADRADLERVSAEFGLPPLFVD
jgi:hypothetical protein